MFSRCKNNDKTFRKNSCENFKSRVCVKYVFRHEEFEQRLWTVCVGRADEDIRLPTCLSNSTCGVQCCMQLQQSTVAPVYSFVHQWVEVTNPIFDKTWMHGMWHTLTLETRASLHKEHCTRRRQFDRHTHTHKQTNTYTHTHTHTHTRRERN